MRKIIISGVPHSGKTTLLEALKHEFPTAYFVSEPAGEVIKTELAKQANDSSYIPIVPWLDYKTFGPVVADKSVELESAIPADTDMVFQDRSLIDTIAYCRLNDFEEFLPEVRRRIAKANYTYVFFCEPVGTYKKTDFRRETAEEARKTHEYLAQAYKESGITTIHLPAAPTSDRVKAIRQYL